MAHDFGGGTTSARVPVGTSEREQSRIPHTKSPPFLFAYHPYRWMCVDGEWLPDLTRKFIDPGVGRVDRTSDTTLMEVSAAKHGWIIIPRDRVPAGTPDGTYLAAYRCRDGLHHCSIWETPQSAGSRAMGHAVDREGYHDWLRWLLKERIVPPITEPVRQRLEAKRRKREAKRAARAGDATPDAKPPAKKAPAKKADADG